MAGTQKGKAFAGLNCIRLAYYQLTVGRPSAIVFGVGNLEVGQKRCVQCSQPETQIVESERSLPKPRSGILRLILAPPRPAAAFQRCHPGRRATPAPVAANGEAL